MSKLLKSKFLLGVLAVAVLFAVTTSVFAADGSVTMTLKKGMKNIQVKYLQQLLNENGYTVANSGVGSAGKESTYFGNATVSAVKKFQAAVGLKADGVFGPASRAKLTGGTTTGGTTTYPAGCTSSTGFSSTTGLPCSGGTTTTPGATGPLTVTLATDNPAAGTIVAGQATADLAHFTFTGTGTLTSVTLQRGGISDQSTLTNVYLYDGVTRLTDGYSFNNAGTLTMNGLNVAVNGSKTLSVRADVYKSTNSYNLSVALTSYTVTGGTATAVNVKGNDMYIATNATLGAAVLSANTVTGTPAVNPGVVGYTLWSAPIQISNRSLFMKSANFRVIGSAPTDALSNVKLYKDGVQVGNVATSNTISGSSYVTFDFSATPVELTTGSHTLDVRADVTKGSARTVQLSLQQASDLMLFDQQVGVNVAATGTLPNTAASVSINQGSVSATLDPSFQTNTKITGGSSNAVIAKFKLHAYGEDVKVNTLNITPVLGTMLPGGAAGLQNVTVYFNGSQVGSQDANWVTADGAIALTPGSQMIVPAGTDSTLEVRADLRNTSGVNYTGGTVKANLTSATGEGMSSHNSVTFPAVTGNTLTLQTGLLAVGSNTGYLSQVMNSNTQNVKIGSYVLQNQSTSESVRVTSMRVTTSFALPLFVSGTVTSGSHADVVVSSSVGMVVGDVITIPGATAAVGGITAISGNTLTVNFTTGGVTPSTTLGITDANRTATSLTTVSNLRTTETSGNGSTPIVPTGTDTFSVDFTLAPGATKTIDIMADLGAADYGTITTKLAVQGTGVSSNTQVFSNSATSLTDVTGQTITMATGSIADPTLVSSSSTPAQFVAAAGTGAANATKATYKFTASNGTATISEMKFTVTGPVTSITVGGQTGTVVAGAVDITGLNLTVPNGGNGVNFDALVSYGPVGTGATASQTLSKITLTDVTYTIGGQPGTLTGKSIASPEMSLVGSKPSLAITSTSNAGLLVGENKLMDVTVTADSHGDISLNTLVFNIASTQVTGPAVNATSTRIAVGSTTVSGSTCTVTGTTAAGVDTCALGGYVVAAGQSVTFSLYGTTTGTLGATGASSVVTSLGAASTFSWNDDAGAAASTAITTANSTYLYNYPTQTWSLHN